MIGTWTRIALAFALSTLVFRPLPGQTFTMNPNPASPVLADASSGYSGASWVDVDNDGKLDLYVNNNFLYKGNGAGGFTKVAAGISSSIALALGNGNSWADYDNDGDLDVYVASANSALYRNNGSGAFTLVNQTPMSQIALNRGWAAAWADLDNDGDLDLVVTHPAGFVPPTGNPTTNHLFLNDGPPNYTFTRVTTGPIVTGFSSYTVGTWSDYDNDGDMDYFIGAGPANGTTQPDFLYRNLLFETGIPNNFEFITEAPIATDQQDGQVWNWIDYDNDGDLDVYVTNYGAPTGLANRLYRNDGGTFTSVATGAIVTDADISLGSVWGDFDNDGDLDCYVTNDQQPGRYYANNGDGTFTSLVNALTNGPPHRGATAGDYDNDGDLDLYADGLTGNRSLFRNDTVNGNHWLKLRLEGVVSNRSAVGAKVRATAQIGGHTVTQLREVSTQNSFNGQNSLIVHFGLGDAATIDRVVIEWPSRIVQTLRNVSANQLLAVREESTTPPVPDGAAIPGTPLLAARSGADVLVTWDAITCPAVAVNLYRGNLSSFAAFQGANCGLPPSGSASVAIPDDSWFLVVATNGGSTDGSYGTRSGGVERPIDGASAVCPAIAQHVVKPSCP
jgi:hypothetical protein